MRPSLPRRICDVLLCAFGCLYFRKEGVVRNVDLLVMFPAENRHLVVVEPAPDGHGLVSAYGARLMVSLIGIPRPSVFDLQSIRQDIEACRSVLLVGAPP